MKHLSALNNWTGLAFLLQFQQKCFLEGSPGEHHPTTHMDWKHACCQLGWEGLGEWWVPGGPNEDRKGGILKCPCGDNANFSCLCGVHVSIQRLWLQPSQQNAWQVACISSSLLERGICYQQHKQQLFFSEFTANWPEWQFKKKTLTLIFPHPLSGEGKGLPLQVCHLHPTPHVY